MDFVDLNNGFLLTGFNDFESALSATEKLCEKGFKVVYLNETSHVREPEVRRFTRNIGEQNEGKYQNYHFACTCHPMENAAESFKSALEVLEKNSSTCAKFVVVVEQKR